jgi:hypothetical protein
MRRLLIPATLICLLVGPASGQTPIDGSPSGALYPVDKCGDPKVPIGVVPQGAGTVSCRLGKDGTPDTASIAVHKVLGLSVAGFRSVAVRALSPCRFDVGRVVALRGPVVVVRAVDLGAVSEACAIANRDLVRRPGRRRLRQPAGTAEDARRDHRSHEQQQQADRRAGGVRIRNFRNPAKVALGATVVVTRIDEPQAMTATAVAATSQNLFFMLSSPECGAGCFRRVPPAHLTLHRRGVAGQRAAPYDP